MPHESCKAHKTCMPYWCWIIIWAPLFLPNLLDSKIPWFMDIVTQFYPMRVHVSHLLWSGELPLWNRTYFAGVPLLANPQWGVLYPGHWLFFLLPFPEIFNLINTAHIASLGVGTFFFLRTVLGKKGWAEGPLFAGILIMIAGWTKAHLAFGAYLQVASFFPWMLFASEKFRATRDNRWLVLGGVFAACQILAGAPQLAVYCQGGLILFCGVQFFIESLFHHRGTEARRTENLQEGCSSLCLCVPVVKRCWLPLKFLTFQAILGILLSAPQWFPTVAFQQECERASKLDLGRVMQGTLDLRGLWCAFVGGTGSPEDAETILYPSIPAIFLALLALGLPVWFALKKRQNHMAPTAAVMASLAALLAALLLSWNVAAPLFYKILPSYANFHDPKRILFLAFFFTLVLAGIGLQRFWDYYGLATTRGKILLGVILITSCSNAITFVSLHVDTKTISTISLERFHQGSIGSIMALHPGERFFAQDIGIQYSYNYTRPNFGETLLPGLSPLEGLEDIQGYDPLIPQRYAAFMRQVNKGMVTLYPTHFGLVRNPESPLLSRFGPLKAVGPVDCDWPMLPPSVLAAGETITLPLQKPWVLPSAEMLVNFLQAYGTWNAEAPAKWQLQVESMQNNKVISGGGFSLFQDVNAVKALNPDIVEGTRIASPNVALFRVTPSADYTTGTAVNALRIRNAANAPVLLYSVGLPRSCSFKHRRYILADVFELPHPNPIETFPTPVPGGQWITGWKYAEKKSNSLHITLPENHPAGWVYVPEPYFSGWTCHVDGQPSEILPCETMFRAVQVSANAKEITMNYWPPRLTEGLLLALGGILISIALWLYNKPEKIIQNCKK